MVVDDDVDSAESLRELLTALGCLAVAAFDGVQGLKSIADFEPHLAFVDLEMPGMSGREVAQAVRERQFGRTTRLVCLTGRGNSEDRRICLEAGFDDFLTKPLAPRALAEALTVAKSQL